MVDIDRKGLLTGSMVGASMPAMSELYPSPPIVYRDVESIAVPYLTDMDAARGVIPPSLEVDDPPTAIMSVLHITNSSIGEFYESQLTLKVLFNGEPRRFNVLMFTTSDSSLAYGRELLGTPKKQAFVRLQREHAGFVGTAERPVGVRLVTAAVSLERHVEPDPEAMNATPSLSLRVMPEPDKGDGPSTTVQLVETNADWSIIEMWQGRGALEYNVRSDIDPFYRLPIREILGGMYTRLDVSAPWPTVVETLTR